MLLCGERTLSWGLDDSFSCRDCVRVAADHSNIAFSLLIKTCRRALKKSWLLLGINPNRGVRSRLLLGCR